MAIGVLQAIKGIVVFFLLNLLLKEVFCIAGEC